MVIFIQSGDVLVFQDECVHAGGPYPNGHIGRFHCFLQGGVMRRDSQNEWIRSIDVDMLREIHLQIEAIVQRRRESAHINSGKHAERVEKLLSENTQLRNELVKSNKRKGW